MSDTKTVVLNIRLTPAMMTLLEARATSERRPARTMAALLVEDGLIRPRLLGPQPLDTKVEHQSGPVLADPVPRAVAGKARGFNLKTKGKR